MTPQRSQAAGSAEGSRRAGISLAGCFGILGLVLALLPRPAAAQAPIADYRLAGTFESSVGGPALQPIGEPGATFSSETIGGTLRDVYAFPVGSGLSVSTSGFLPADTYSVAILFRFTSLQDYRRILDMKNGSADSGLYGLNGRLTFFPQAAGTEAPLVSDRFAQVVLTRDAGGSLSGYVNGIHQFTMQDAGGDAVVDPAGVLRFFVDDDDVAGEQSAGAVARIRLWSSALSAEQVAALDDNQPAGPSPSPSPSASQPPVEKVEADVSIRYNGSYFNGYVRPEEEGTTGLARQAQDPSAFCDNGRRVRIKREEPGRDPSVGRDRSNYRGYYRVPEEAEGGAVYYSVVKRKEITLDSGETIVCVRAESKHLRAPRQ